MTGSELKTIVWRITSTFASAVPVEEQLRQLVPAAGETNVPRMNIEKAASHLDSLIHVFEQLSVPRANNIASDKVPPVPAPQTQTGGLEANGYPG